jgi:hypothetical protein
MTALCKAYDDPTAADRAVEALIAAGVPGKDVRLLMGAKIHDARREAGGGFAGSVAPDAGVGDFAGAHHARTAARSSFAGAAAAPREAVFANADRDVVVTYPDGEQQSRVTGHHRLRKLLMDAGLDEPTADADVRALHEGRALVLVHIAAISPDEVRSLLDAAAGGA